MRIIGSHPPPVFIMYYPVDGVKGFVATEPMSFTLRERVTDPVFVHPDARIKDDGDFLDIPFDHHHTLYRRWAHDGDYARAKVRIFFKEGKPDWSVPIPAWWPERPDLCFWYNLDADQFWEVEGIIDEIYEYYNNTLDYTIIDEWCIYVLEDHDE